MTYEQLALCERDPKFADDLIHAMQQAISFRKGRGALLRSLRDQPQSRRPFLRLVSSKENI